MIKASTLTLGLALTLATLGSAGHETRQGPSPESATPQVRLASAHIKPQSQDGGHGGSRGFHLKGCRGKHTAQSRASTHGGDIRYYWVEGIARGSATMRVTETTYYYLCTSGKDRIKPHLTKACFIHTVKHPRYLWFQGVVVTIYIWDRVPGLGVDGGTITVPDGHEQEGEPACKRHRIPKSEQKWLHRYDPHRHVKKPNTHVRWEGRIKIGPLQDDTPFWSPIKSIDPHTDHRFR